MSAGDFYLAPGEKIIQCPYNTSHQITNARILTHLDKCRRQYRKNVGSEKYDKEMKICRHNATHHVPGPEIAFHENRCEDAHSVVRHLAYHGSAQGKQDYERRRQQDLEEFNQRHSSSGGYSSTSSRDTKPAGADLQNWNLEAESWEDEAAGYTPGYDPQQKLKKEVIMYNPAGLTKSERKRFRKEVREKAVGIGDDASIELPTASSFDVRPDLKEFKMHKKGANTEADREPGELSDDDNEGNKTGPGRLQQSRSQQRPPNSYNQTSQQSSRSGPQSSFSASARGGTSSTFRYQQTGSRYDPCDTDDFEGFDPYAE